MVASFKGVPSRVIFSGDGRRAAVVGRSPTIELYDTDRKSKLAPVFPSRLLDGLFPDTKMVPCIALSADGSRLAFNAVCQSPKPLKRQGAAFQTMYDALAVTGGDAGRLLFYNDVAATSSGRLVASTRCVAITPDGNSLLSSTGSQLRLWDLSRAKEENEEPVAILDFQGRQADHLACSPDSRYAVAALRDSLHVCRLQGPDSSVSTELKGANRVRCVACTYDAHVLAGDAGGTIRVWAVPKQAKEGESTSPSPELKNWHAKAEVLCVAAAPQGPFFASGGADGFVCLGKIGDKQPLWREKSGGAAVKAVAFSADGRHVLFATEKGIGRLSVGQLPEAEVKQ
jgi:WD40 repeat protein